MSRKDVITDHAVLRFIERKYGLDVEAEREKIRAIVTPFLSVKCAVLKRDGLKFLFRDGYVVTVLTNDMSSSHHPTKERA